jgi:hypothetical protein
MQTQQKGLRAALTVKKFVPLQKEETKDGDKETRQLVLKGDFVIFVDGQAHPQTLPTKLEFKDEPSVVALVQQALNVEDTGQKCLLTVHSNKQGKLDQYYDWLEKKKVQQKLEFGPEEGDQEAATEEEE